MAMKKGDRKRVYNKYDGYCAYCGCGLSLSKFEIDHMVPIMRGITKSDLIKYGYNHIKGNDDFSNLMPACKQCNRQKKAYSVETWRKVLKGKIGELNRDSSVYRTAKRFGLIEEIDIDIKFYFEKIEMSADTFIGIGKFHEGYRVTGVEQAPDNITYSKKKESRSEYKNTVRSYFGLMPVFKTHKEAMDVAVNIEDEYCGDDMLVGLEHGIIDYGEFDFSLGN